jgi:hypothetical protein
MTPRSLAAAILYACALAPATPALADPAYLPPFLDRAPSLGDRWVYAAYDFLGNHSGYVTVEVVEVEETADGWRYLVDDQLEFLPELAAAGVQPVRRNEWFCGADGATARGDVWVDGVLSVDLRKPLVVIRELPLSVLERRRFGHLGWPKPVKRRGWISPAWWHLSPGSRLLYPVQIRLADRTQPTLLAKYDPVLGKFDWTDRAGLGRRLVSAVIDGVEWEAPFTPQP